MWVYILYIIWLMGLAYVDYKTGYVYCRMCMSGIIPAAICIVKLLTNHAGILLPVLLCIVIMIVFVRFLGSFRIVGEGDADVFVITSIVNSVYFAENGICDFVSLLINNCILLYFAMLLFTVRYVRRIDWRHMRLDKCYPLLPSVYMSTIIYGIIVRLLYN